MQLVRAVSALTLLQTPSLLAFPRIPASRIASPPRRGELGPSGGSRCGRRAPFVIPAAFSPAAGAAADPEVISMHSALVWGAGGRPSCQAAQTNKLRRQREAEDPEGCENPAAGGRRRRARSGWEKAPKDPIFLCRSPFSRLTRLEQAGDAFRAGGAFPSSRRVTPKGDCGYLGSSLPSLLTGPQLGAAFHPKSHLWDTQLGAPRSWGGIKSPVWGFRLILDFVGCGNEGFGIFSPRFSEGIHSQHR